MSYIVTTTWNNATGSDTQASGYSSSGQTVFGSGASTNNTTTVDVSADAPDLSPFVANDLLFVGSGSGRRFSLIVSVDNTAKTITCADTFGLTESGLAWAIGGKRKTLTSAFSSTWFNSSNAKAGWRALFEDAQSWGTGIAVTAVGNTTDGPITLEGSGDTPIVMTMTANDEHFTASGNGNIQHFRNLEFQNTNATKTAAFAITTGNTATVFAYHCIFGDETNKLGSGFNNTTNSAAFFAQDCCFTDCTIDGINHTTAGTTVLKNCTLRRNVIGLDKGTSGGSVDMDRCLVYENSSDGVVSANLAPLRILNSTFDFNGGDGLDLSGSGGSSTSGNIIQNCNFTRNGGYGVRGTALGEAMKFLVDYNNFGTGAWANTSGSMLAFTAGANDIAVDPEYIDPDNDDYAVEGDV